MVKLKSPLCLDLSSFMHYHRVCNKSNTEDVTGKAGTTYLSGTPEFTLSFCGVSVVKSLVVCGGCLHHYLSYCLFFELRFPFIPLVSSSFP